jgi:hypothetical protein
MLPLAVFLCAVRGAGAPPWRGEFDSPERPTLTSTTLPASAAHAQKQMDIDDTACAVT